MQIDKFRFGCFTINNTDYKHDIKIINGKIKIWNYTKHHTVILEDVEDLIEDGIEIIIIGTGTSNLVVVEDDVKKLIKEKQIRLIAKKTQEACQDFNDFTRQGKKINAILHATC